MFFIVIYLFFRSIKSYIDNPAYVAVGLSTDNRMGEDAVMECVPENGQIRAYASWTTPSPNLGVVRQGVVSVTRRRSSEHE